MIAGASLFTDCGTLLFTDYIRSAKTSEMVIFADVLASSKGLSIVGLSVKLFVCILSLFLISVTKVEA